MRESQKNIIIGKGGSGIKRVGMEARKALETFLESKVFLELRVKVRENWRDNEQQLSRFGYWSDAILAYSQPENHRRRGPYVFEPLPNLHRASKGESQLLSLGH